MLRWETAKAIGKTLQKDNIESHPIWKPMHLQPYYESYDYFAHDNDVSADIFKRGLRYPSV